MINALKALGHNQFEFARWAPEQYDCYKTIRVQVVSEDEKRWSTVIQNLMTNADSLLLRTAFVYDYQPRQHIRFRDKWWEIRSVADITQDVNAQATALVNCGAQQFILELGRVDGYDVK